MSVTKAFVFGAGMGTRLRPITDMTPKPLIPIVQKPLITFALDHLIAAGVNSFAINTHRLPQQFEERFGEGRYRNCDIALVHEPDLLETGGGMKNAEPLLKNGPFLTYSGDILCDVDLPMLIDEHFRANNDVTLALRQTGLASAIALRDGRIVDITEKYGIPGTYDFANIAVWTAGVFDRIAPHKKISFIPPLIEWIGQGGRIGGVVLDQGEWFNVGSAGDYLRAHSTVLQGHWRPHFVSDPGWPQPVHDTADVAPGAKMLGCTVIGPNCRVGDDVVLEDTIVWPGAEITSRSRLSRCIVRSRQIASGTHQDHVF